MIPLASLLAGAQLASHPFAQTIYLPLLSHYHTNTVSLAIFPLFVVYIRFMPAPD